MRGAVSSGQAARRGAPDISLVIQGLVAELGSGCLLRGLGQRPARFNADGRSITCC